MPDPATEDDVRLMRRALALAARGRGSVEPNPMVGCVIARGGRVIGEGFHERFGGPHAEPNALAACREDPRGATAYVTLEPCCHTNKKTPPCVPRLIEAGVARVVVGCVDPNPQVAGRGIAELRTAGIEVVSPVLETECRQANAAFFKRVKRNRPYVTLKWAESSNGKVAGARGRRVWISNPASTRAVHAMRARCEAILVGINTAVADDPLLTTRGVPGGRSPIRIVLDADLRLSPESRLARSTEAAPVWIFCGEDAPRRSPQRVASLTDLGVRVVPVPVREPSMAGASRELSLQAVLDNLHAITHLLVEPGPTLAASFFRQNLADRVWVICSPSAIEEIDAPSAVAVDYPASGSVDLQGDRLTEYLNPTGPAFFTLAPSADLSLAGAQT